MLTFSQPATASACGPSFSIGEMNLPSAARSTTWVEIRLASSARVRSTSPSPSSSVVLWTQSLTRATPSSSGSARIRTRPWIRRSPSNSNGPPTGSSASSPTATGGSSIDRSTP